MTYYDEISEGYEELHKEEQLKKIEIIKSHLKTKESDMLLDVGCGTGLTTRPWKCVSFGIDPAIKLLQKAEKGNYANAEAENIPFKDNTFDIVISVTAIQNFHDIEKALKEIKRAAKEDAQIVITCLKKSPKIDLIRSLIKDNFAVKKEIEEEKDIIFILSHKTPGYRSQASFALTRLR